MTRSSGSTPSGQARAGRAVPIGSSGRRGRVTCVPTNGTSEAGAVPEPDCSVGIDDWLICVARTDTGCRRVLEAPDRRMAGRSCESERRHVAVHSFVLPRSHLESLVPDPDVARVTNHFVELSPRLQVRQVGIARKWSRSSKLRQYWTRIVVRPIHCWYPRQPSSGCSSITRNILGIAVATGHHFRTFHGLLKRIPIRNTTKSPSTSAVNRPPCTPIGHQPSLLPSEVPRTRTHFSALAPLVSNAGNGHRELGAQNAGESLHVVDGEVSCDA